MIIGSSPVIQLSYQLPNKLSQISIRLLQSTLFQNVLLLIIVAFNEIATTQFKRTKFKLTLGSWRIQSIIFAYIMY